MSDPKNFQDFGKYMGNESDKVELAWITQIQLYADEIKQDEERLARCQPMDKKEIPELFKTGKRNGEEIRLFELASLNEVLDRIPVEDPQKEYGHECKSVRNKAEVDKALRKVQDIKIYGSREEIAERIYKEISSQAYSRRILEKDEFIVSTLVDVCENLKEKNSDLAKFLIPGITKRIASNMTRYENMEVYDPNAQDLVLAKMMSEETFERFFRLRSGKKLTEKEEKDLSTIKEKVREYREEQAKKQEKEPQKKEEPPKNEVMTSIVDRLKTDKAIAVEVSRRVETEEEITAENFENIVNELTRLQKERQKGYIEAQKALEQDESKTSEKSAEITDEEGKQQLGTMSEDMNVDIDGQNRALVEITKGRQEDLSKKPISDQESRTALVSKEQPMVVADQPQLDSEGKKIEGQETANLSKKSEGQSTSKEVASKENQSNETFETASATDSEGSDTTSSASDNVHQESENNNLPAKDSVFNRIKRGFINFINNITGKKEKETEDNSLPPEDKKDSVLKENQETDFDRRIQVEGATGKIQESDLNADNRTSDTKAKNTGNSADKKADDQGPEQEM